MGLDMVLERRIYVKNSEFTKKPQRYQITVEQGGKPCKDIDADRISYLVEEIGCWSEANHIHKWFVEYVQSGVDDQREYPVYREQQTEDDQRRGLDHLLWLCESVISASELVPVKGKEEKGLKIANPTVAMKYLPTYKKRGKEYYFGSRAYDEIYLAHCQETVRIINDAFVYWAWDTEWEVYYRASW